LKRAYYYTPSLSGLIKIAQMLVIQKVVILARDGIVRQPSNSLDEMRARFLARVTRSPSAWANRLRMYDKKVRDSPTCLGFISWSNDSQSFSYQKITNISMEAFKDFAPDQVLNVQTQLEDLLLLHPNKTREDLGIGFWMHQVVDNVAYPLVTGVF